MKRSTSLDCLLREGVPSAESTSIGIRWKFASELGVEI